jgi:hypothetical protein
MSFDSPHLSAATRENHERAWRALARAIAARKREVRQEPPNTPAKRGHLTVIGSGIETLGFTLGDDELLRKADRVFFCVADPATVVFIRRLRPDAYDLYVLYDDGKPRYVTYMQMAEAMLHYVREGEHVVCVFYGHPGIFVLATHRAILIARREGHHAVMRPGISALDCLCADLGVDPCHPGMQTHEATDMLIRRREPDVTLHVVLWQVGLIGEMGFRRAGYLNRNFSILISYLQDFYGPDYPVTHYVASRYPTVPPLIETYELSALHDPATQTKVTGLSTFYLAPRDAAEADPDMVARLGLLKPGQSVRTPSSALREIGLYGRREMKAFDDFARFDVPPAYHWQADQGAARFLIALRQDVGLQRLYAVDPERALQDARFAGLTAEEGRLLARRDSGAIQVAAKGLHRHAVSNHALIGSLLSDRGACADLLRRRRADADRDPRAFLHDYAARHDAGFAPERFLSDLAQVRRQSLLAWTGVYATGSGEVSLVVVGDRRGRGGLLFVNGEAVPGFIYRHGGLEWRMADRNPSNGFVRFDIGKNGRRVFGHVWRAERVRPDGDRIEASEVDPDRAHLSGQSRRFQRGDDHAALRGRYSLRLRRGDGFRRMAFDLAEAAALLDGGALRADLQRNGELTLADGSGEVAAAALCFLCNPLTGCPEFVGTVTLRGGERVPCFGSRLDWPAVVDATDTALPAHLAAQLAAICHPGRGQGPSLLWHTWEKLNLTSRVVHGIGPWLESRRQR